MHVVAHPWWIAVILAAIGLILTASSVVAPLRSLVRVRRRSELLQRAQLFIDLDQLQIRLRDIASTSEKLDPLLARTRAALASLNESARTLRLPQAMAALRAAAIAVRLLARTLGAH